jgi:hypothetical protein
MRTAAAQLPLFSFHPYVRSTPERGTSILCFCGNDLYSFVGDAL